MPQIVVTPRIIRNEAIQFSMAPLSMSAAAPGAANGATKAKLDHYRAVLQSYGIGDLSSLGKLSLSGALVPQAGVMAALPGLTAGSMTPSASAVPASGSTIFQSAFALATGQALVPGSRKLVSIGGTAALLSVIPEQTAPSRPAPVLLQSKAVWVDVAYWAASWIDLADNTTVILKSPNHYLVILCEQLTVGENVTFTWERPTPSSFPAKPATPGAPGQPPTSSTIDKPPAAPAGTAGIQGGCGTNGVDASNLEIWTLQMTGSPAIDQRGQDGFQGGAGGDGGPGGHGAAGKPDATGGIFNFCVSGPGNGGDGGTGGPGGNGGPGGTGGTGGSFSLYAPQAVLNAYIQGRIYISVDGGTGGPGGLPGSGGPGGAGGARGDNSHNCAPAAGEVRTAGNNGPIGHPGAQGASGQAGSHGTITLQAISADDFHSELDKPALINVAPQRAHVGDLVNATGLRFAPGDVIYADNIACETQVVSDTLVTFQIPALNGGNQPVRIQRSDGTTSNNCSLYILPVVSSAPQRARPGSSVQLKGTGFAPNIRVRLNGQDMPNVSFLDSRTVSFAVIRPVSTAPNAAGETVTLQAILPDGTSSNSLTLTMDTLRMLVAGDSIMWGQGLQPTEKFHDQVEQAVKAKHGDIGLYKDVVAHSGATIGVGDATSLPALNGEVPTSYPTIVQQASALSAAIANPQDVGLILLDGGTNDVSVPAILSPLTGQDTLKASVDTHCGSDMRALLTTLATAFPSAKIIVTGYYAIISDQTDITLLEAFMIAAGLELGGIPGAVVDGVVTAAVKATVVAQSKLFADEANKALAASVAAVNASLKGSPRIFFADPMFGPDNAALAPNAFIYGIHSDLSPEDPLAVSGPRANACSLAGSARTNVEVCKRASVGHPNVKGANAYAKAVFPFL
jgi:hypothetical protein